MCYNRWNSLVMFKQWTPIFTYRHVVIFQHWQWNYYGIFVDCWQNKILVVHSTSFFFPAFFFNFCFWKQICCHDIIILSSNQQVDWENYPLLWSESECWYLFQEMEASSAKCIYNVYSNNGNFFYLTICCRYEIIKLCEFNMYSLLFPSILKRMY